MQTIICILAAIILIAVIIIAIKGNKNLNRFYNNMDNIYDEAQKEAQEYINHLNKED